MNITERALNRFWYVIEWILLKTVFKPFDDLHKKNHKH